ATPPAGAAPAPAAPPPKAPAPVAAATPEVAATPMVALKTHWRIAAGCVAAVIALTAVGVSLVKKAPAPDPLAFVTAQIGQTPCSWLRVSDHSSVDGIEAYRLSGASSVQPAVISRNILRDAKARKVDVDQVIATDVAPLDPQRCGWIETLKPFRYAGIPRFELRLETMKRGVTRAELTFNAAELGPAGALYGVEPSGAVQRIVGRTELAKLGPPAVIHHDDGSYTLNVDTDRSGWNGIVFMESKTAAPQGLVELPLQSVAERQRFTNLARAGGWRFELAWFKVEP
uniref:hypothetical protein n=1 Tax=Phenylobacterium sp. TaxID=1871053 RepID=UPI0025E4A672